MKKTILLSFILLFSLKVHAQVNPITNLSALIEYYENEIKLTWTHPGPYSIPYMSKYEIQKSTFDYINWSTGIPDNISIISFWTQPGENEYCLITGLSQTATNYFHVWISSGNEISMISNEASVWTEIHIDTIPPAAITDLDAEGAYNGFFLLWTAPGDDGLIGRVHHYEIIFTTDSGFDWSNASP